MLDILVAAPSQIRIGGKPYLVGALKLYELGLLQRYIRDHAGPAPAGREESWPPSIHVREGMEILLADLDGQLFFLGVFFRKHQPDLTEQDVEGIAKVLGGVEFWTFWAIATGADDLDPEEVRATMMARERTLLAAQQAAIVAPGETDPTTASSSPKSG